MDAPPPRSKRHLVVLVCTRKRTCRVAQAARLNEQPVRLCVADDLGQGWQQHSCLRTAHAATGDLFDDDGAGSGCCCAALQGDCVDANSPKLIDNTAPHLQT